METTRPNQQFELIIKEFNAPAEISNTIATTLQMYFDKYAEYKSMIESLVVNDINDTGKMSIAREMRLDLKNKRIESEKLVDKKRDELKRKMANDVLQDKIWLRSGQMIEAMFKNLESLAAEKENYAINEIKKQKTELAQQRRKLLEPYQDYVNVMAYDLENMPEDQFQITLKGIQHSYDEQQKQIRERKEAGERQAKRKEELIIEGFQFNGNYFMVNKQILFNITELLELSDEDYGDQKARGILLIEEEKIRQEERDAEIKRLNDEKELRTKRLGKLFNSYYGGEGVFYNGELIMTDAQLIGFNDIEFAKQIRVHEKRVIAYNKEQELIKQQKKREEEKRQKELQELRDKQAEAERLEAERKQKELDEIAAKEKLETGSDKEKLQHLCDSWMNYKSELVLKTKKAQAVLKRFDINFGIVVSNLKGDIDKL